MNCLLIEETELDRATMRVRLDGRRRRHADEILKVRAGDSLRVGVVGGQLGRGEILTLDREVLELAIDLEAEPPAKLPLHVVLAMPRPPVFRRLLATLASLGVESLLVAGTARTEKSFWQSRVLDPEAIHERMLLGLEQARDTVVPEFLTHRYFESLVDEVLAPRIEGRRAIVAHPAASEPCPHALGKPVTLFIGPEGGFVDFEMERLKQIGFESVSLGPRILRVEPVIPLLVGRLFG
ncbi:16S rRNA (uracil(1498)-N(3))-methyltransferase [Myxococcota bacterium]|nr:16S rRNA (uracil(1498)-N(3))-methyltransferase [Myxococcota bacterium]